jgi:hypothetical protein
MTTDGPVRPVHRGSAPGGSPLERLSRKRDGADVRVKQVAQPCVVFLSGVSPSWAKWMLESTCCSSVWISSRLAGSS